MKKLFFFFIMISLTSMRAQWKEGDTITNRKGSTYRFVITKINKATPVKNQHRTGTCWSFSGLSFLESEVMRKGGPETDLSEMWVARHAYLEKARNYIRTDGHTNFGQGSLFHDVTWTAATAGLVPEKAYPGRAYGGDKHHHGELHAVLHNMLKALNKRPQGGKLTPVWFDAFRRTLDTYLGEVPGDPEEYYFIFKGKSFNPKSFVKYLKINPEDYEEYTSFTHHPFYTSFPLEIPDNWHMLPSRNVPVDELVRITEHALQKGYTVAWGSDVSEKGFSHRNGLAVMPEDPRTVSRPKSDSLYFTVKGQKVPNAFLQPVKEVRVTQKMRQEAFETKATTDDHGMHIIGLARDQKGNKYFIVKNSWGASNDLGGYLLVSYPYFAYKTTMIMVHKDAVPKDIRKKFKNR
ncbi:MAG: aminopeptidase [Chlorobi bacterium]|nr:aminopeptidase [Chlorobiota bacterium]